MAFKPKRHNLANYQPREAAKPVFLTRVPDFDQPPRSPLWAALLFASILGFSAGSIVLALARLVA